MKYLLPFLEGIITFISPCLLPMLPIYIFYFTAGAKGNKTKRTLINSIGFVFGFTVVFVAMGALAGTLGALLSKYGSVFDIATGAVVILFGLNYLGVLKINIFKGSNRRMDKSNSGFLSAFVFGIVFSFGWTPCIGTFLGSAIMLASQQESAVTGLLMLLFYSLGLGIPFIISAVLIDKLKSMFNFLKKNHKKINIVCGLLLIVMGVLMMSGLMNKLLV